MSEPWQLQRARLAATRRHHPEADTTELERELALGVERARLDRHIDELVAAAPRMTAEQRDRLVLAARTQGGEDA